MAAAARFRWHWDYEWFTAAMQLPQQGSGGTGTTSGLLQGRDCRSVIWQAQVTNRLNERVNKMWLQNNSLH